MTDRDQLIVDHLPFAYRIANQHFIPGHDRDDVAQEAACALVEAAASYDPAQGSFRAFAGVVIRRRIYDRICHERREKRRAQVDAVYDTGDNAAIDLVVDYRDPVETRAELRALVDGWQRLTPLERRALLCVINGTDYSNDKAADNGIQRAKRKLRAA